MGFKQDDQHTIYRGLALLLVFVLYSWLIYSIGWLLTIFVGWILKQI
jgi:hypothetical protein